MKVEQREVTVIHDVYIADDGTEFDDKYECESHDYRLNEAKLYLYDSKLRRTDFDSCAYAKLVTEDDVKRMISVCDYNGVTSKGIVEPGIYMYDNYDGWLNITEVVAKIYGGAHDQT